MYRGDHLRQLELALRRVGNPLTNYFRHTREQRGNTPSKAERHVAVDNLKPAQQQETLWIMDKVLEEQTMTHFFPCVLGSPLPNGRQTELPLLLGEEIDYFTQPLSEWAPPPHDTSDQVPMDEISTHIASFEDETNLILITKELKTIKTLVWSGIAPVSERRWRDLDLDSPAKFHDACQYFCAVIDVFHYLNMPEVKARLRQTYNSIWDQLKIVEFSLNNLRRAKGEPKISLTGLWYEYMNAFFTTITYHAHHWVTTHIERLRGPVLQRLADYISTKPQDDEGRSISAEEMDLSNKLHDLVENAAQADTAIFLPMDGYKGSDLVSQDNAPPPNTESPYREEPISFSANKLTREADYYSRLKYLTTYQRWKEFDHLELASVLDRVQKVFNGDSICVSQIIAQHQARMELRGPPPPPIAEPWITETRRDGCSKRWGFVAYRLCYDHTDEEWEMFKAKFESDISDWRNEMPDMEDIKSRSTVEWREPRSIGLPENDVDAIRKHFNSLDEFDLIPEDKSDEIVLAADKAVIDSYLKPVPGQRGFVLAIDVGFDPDDDWRKSRGESPGYPGVMRILGSVLWDDVSASILLQSRWLDDMWVLAMDHPVKLYEGYMPRHAPA